MLRLALRAAKFSLLIVTGLSLQVACAGQEKQPELFDLHTKTPKGTTAWFVESMLIEQKIDTGNNLIDVKLQLDRTFRIAIKQVDAKGVRIVEIQIARVAGWIQTNDQQKSTFDTEKPNAGDRPAGGWMQRMADSVGQRYLARIDANGKLAGSLAGVAHEMQGKDTAKSMTVWELADLAETAFGRPPAKPLAINDTWSFVQAGTDELGVSNHATMQLMNVTQEAFEMSVTGTVVKAKPRSQPTPEEESDPQSLEGQADRIRAETKISDGKLAGTQRLSRHDGLVLETKLKSTFDIDIPLPNRKESIAFAMTTKLTRIDKPVLKDRKQLLAEATRTAKTDKSKTDAKMIADAVRMYYAKNGKLPSSLAVLAEQDKKGRSEILELPKDGWGQDYKLVKGDTPRSFEVVSAGPDKKHGTADDISSKTKRR